MRKREEKDGEEGWMWRIDEKENMRKMDEKDGCKGYMRGDENDGG